ncbi:MAG: ribosomal protein S18-alanine N-acetyltransferase [Bryobacteraceae bacterium]
MTGNAHRIIDGRPFLPGQRRIALLSGRFPAPRVFHLLRQAACEFDVVLFALADGAECEALLEFCSRFVLAEAPEALRELWDRLPRELNVDARQVDGTEMAAYGGDLLTAAAIEPTPRAWRDWRRRAMLRRFLRVATIPDGVDLDSHPPSPEPEGLRVFLAQADRGWFIDRVWPGVTRRFPQAELVSSYEEANVVVGPALEAMAIERAIAATRGAPESLGLRHNVSAWIATDAAAGLAEGIVTLLGDPELRRRLAQAARRIAEERFDWKQIGATERGLLREIVERPPIIRPARKEDVPELDRIQRLSPEAVLWEASGYLSYDCRVAELRGRVAGFVVCRKLSADESEILSLVVDPEVRRRGVGSRLMREILEHRTGTTWYLEVRESNGRARNLYRKLGFEDISLRPAYYQDTGEAAVVMRLKPC